MENTELKVGDIVRHRSNKSAPTMIIIHLDSSTKKASCHWWDEASSSFKLLKFSPIELKSQPGL